MAKRNLGASALAKAQAVRGRDPGNVIGGQVVERIVNNSTKEFQNYLASVGGGNAMAAANQAVSSAPGFVGGTSPTGQRPPGMPSPYAGAAASAGRGSLIAAQQATLPQMEFDRPGMYGRSAQLPPGLERLFAQGSRPAGLMGNSASRWGDDEYISALLPYDNMYDAGTADIKGPTVYEDGSMRRGIPAPLWPVGPQPGAAPVRMPEINAPAPPMLGVPQAPAFDPEREALLRYLGMI